MTDDNVLYVLTDADGKMLKDEVYHTDDAAIDARVTVMEMHPHGDEVTVERFTPSGGDRPDTIECPECTALTDPEVVEETGVCEYCEADLDLEEILSTPDAPYYCPWCEAVIAIEGEVVTRRADAYWHTYDHMDKAPDAMLVLEEFERLDIEETEQHEV